MKNPFEPGNIGIWATTTQFREIDFAKRVVQYWADYLPRSDVPDDNEDYHYCFPREWLQFQKLHKKPSRTRKPSVSRTVGDLPKKPRQKAGTPVPDYNPFAFELEFVPLGKNAISMEMVNGESFVVVTLAPFWLETSNSRSYCRVRSFSEIESHLRGREASFYDRAFEEELDLARSSNSDSENPLMIVLGPKVYLDHEFKPSMAPTSFYEKKARNLYRCTYCRDDLDNFHLYLGAWPTAKDLNMSEDESIATLVLSIAPQIETDLKSVKEELVSVEDRVAQLRRRLGSLIFLKNVTNTGFKEEFKSTLEKIRQDSRVASIQMQGIYTRMLTVPTFTGITKDRPHSYFLGEFEFRFSIDKGIEVRNLHLPTNDDRIHPHGWNNSVCLGTYEQVFNSCYANFDFYTLFLTLLEWVTDINPEDHRATRSLGNIFKTTKPKVKKASAWVPFLTLDASDTQSEGP